MPRNARIVVPGSAHHLTQRGIRRFPVFRDTEDRAVYLEVVAQNCARYGVSIRAWCLMTNHVHFVLVPDRADSLALAFRRAHSTYARRFNLKYKLSGYLWQNRFYSCPLDEFHMWNAIRYVEQNPVRAGMVTSAEEYPWSSARGRCGSTRDLIVDAGWAPESPIGGWSQWLAADLGEAVKTTIRRNTTSGYPYGSESFVAGLEQEFGRPLRRRPPGPKASSWDGGRRPISTR